VPYPPQPSQQPTPPQHDYSFITDPSKPPRKRLLPGSGSLLGRVIVVSVGLLLLIIVFVVIKGLLSGGSASPAFVGIAQDQQELIHLATAAGEESGLNETNKNFAVTTQLSLTSAQTDLLTYLSKNGTKVKEKQLALKISATTDQQLSAAATSNTYNETFNTIMQTKLTEYQKDLQQVYDNKATGKNGKELLSKDYAAANLLLKQLNPETN
jgi:hypothetical protein